MGRPRGSEERGGAGGGGGALRHLRDVGLALADVLELLGVGDDDLHAHRHLRLAEVDVEQRDLRVLDGARHPLRGAAAVEDVAVHQGRVLRRAAVLLHDGDRAHRVVRLPRLGVVLLHHHHRVDRHLHARGGGGGVVRGRRTGTEAEW